MVVVRNVGNGNPHALLAEGQNGAATVEVSVAVAQNIKNKSTTLSSHTTPEHTPKNFTYCFRDACFCVLITALFTTVRAHKSQDVRQ